MLVKVLSNVILILNNFFGMHTVQAKNGNFILKGFPKIYSSFLASLLITGTVYFYGPRIISIILNREKLIWLLMYIEIMTFPINAAISLILQTRTSSESKIKVYRDLIMNQDMKSFLTEKETEISDRSRCVYFFVVVIHLVITISDFKLEKIVNFWSNYIIEMTILQFHVDIKLAILSFQYMNAKFKTLCHDFDFNFERTSISNTLMNVNKYKQFENKYDIVLNHLVSYEIIGESVKLMLAKINIVVSII